MKKTKTIIGYVLLTACMIVINGERLLHAQQSNDKLFAKASFKSDEKIDPKAPIEIELSRELTANEKIALLIGQLDVSSLFTQNGTRFVYEAVLPMPVGNSILTVYSVNENGLWKEISKFPIAIETVEEKVEPNDVTEKPIVPETDGGDTKTEELSNEKPESRKFNFLPSFTIAMKAQPFQSNFPLENQPAERATFNDFTFTGSVKTESKIGILTTDTNFDFAGSSFKPETLQFGEKGEDAPDIDLASYLMNFQAGKAKFAWGHTSFGENRNLVSSFSSRGLTFELPINKRFDVKAGVLNGTSLVGVGNFTGLGQIRHQVQGATFGIEFFPKRRNAMRLEITGFNAYLQAENNVSEGRINDAERSRGFGMRFITSDTSERFKMEFGYALSRFFNPEDTELDPDGNAVALPAVIRSAAYVEASYQILKDLKLTESNNLNLNFAFKFEVAEPLYKSLGASASADRITQDFALEGSIGEFTFQLGHARSNDNLASVASILRSLTRGNRFAVALPVSAILKRSDKLSPFLPRLGYSFDQTHQFGEGIPVNGGFDIDLSTIPDQINTNQNFTSSWQFAKFNVDYTYSRTFADNRQADFAQNDQLGFAHGVSVAVNPLQTLSLSVGVNFDTSKNLEILQTNRTKTLTFGTNLQPFKGATISANFSNTLSGDAANIVNNRNANFDIQFAYNFTIERSKFKKFGMQAFVRFADTFTRTGDLSIDLNDRTRTKIVNAGLTFNFF